MGRTFNHLAVAGIVGVGGVWAYNHFDPFTAPKCLREPGFESCGIAGVGEAIDKIATYVPFTEDAVRDNMPYTAEITGGVTDVEITPQDWPLFDRKTVLETELKKGSEIRYKEESQHIVSTKLGGKVVAIIWESEVGEKEVYVAGVHDGGTPEDMTDDRVVPINVNDYDMVSQTGHTRVYDGELAAEYQTCVDELNNGNSDYQGCVLSGIDGHDENVPAPVLENIRQEHLYYDGCVTKSLHVASNFVQNGLYHNTGWDEVHDGTLTSADITARSLQERFHGTLGVPIENVNVVMATDDNNQLIEWEPDDRPDLSNVEVLSNGEYEPEGVRIPQYCLEGIFSNEPDPARTEQYLLEEVGPKLMDPLWQKDQKYTPPGPVPAAIFDIRFDANGNFVARP